MEMTMVSASISQPGRAIPMEAARASSIVAMPKPI
jgi:hypothetical protein